VKLRLLSIATLTMVQKVGPKPAFTIPIMPITAGKGGLKTQNIRDAPETINNADRFDV
jgi:hypothetical protein